ncbi:MAG: hypothetical protein OEY97_06455 [Nitrospirota bacterium]|nr:hypothetical protein [Nitrospirota bacterium]
MPRKSVQVELTEVSLNRRFRKFKGDKPDRKAKVRARAKVDVVQVESDQYGVTIRRGTVTVKKGVVSGPDLTEKSVKSAVQRDIRAGKYDAAIFDEYDRISAAKKK